jgi:hypothetical protein
MTARRLAAVALFLLVAGCGDGKGGVRLPCWVGKDFSVAKSADDLRRLPAESEWVRARGVSDDAGPELARFRHLRALDFGSGSKALRLKTTAKGLAKISELRLDSLETLTFVASPEIDDACLRQIAKVRTLTGLCLSECSNFSKGGFAALSAIPNLRGLTISGCAQIDDAWIDDVARLRGLREIDIPGTGISTSGRARLRSLMPDCVVDDDEERWAVEK